MADLQNHYWDVCQCRRCGSRHRSPHHDERYRRGCFSGPEISARIDRCQVRSSTLDAIGRRRRAANRQPNSRHWQSIVSFRQRTFQTLPRRGRTRRAQEGVFAKRRPEDHAAAPRQLRQTPPRWRPGPRRGQRLRRIRTALRPGPCRCGAICRRSGGTNGAGRGRPHAAPTARRPGRGAPARTRRCSRQLRRSPRPWRPAGEADALSRCPRRSRDAAARVQAGVLFAERGLRPVVGEFKDYP